MSPSPETEREEDMVPANTTHGAPGEEVPTLRCQRFVEQIVAEMRKENAVILSSIQESVQKISDAMIRGEERQSLSRTQLEELRNIVLGNDGLRDMARDSDKFRKRYAELQIEGAVIDMAKYIEEARKAHVLGESYESRRFRAIFIAALCVIGAVVMATGGYFFNAAMTARDHIHDSTIHHVPVNPPSTRP